MNDGEIFGQIDPFENHQSELIKTTRFILKEWLDRAIAMLELEVGVFRASGPDGFLEVISTGIDRIDAERAWSKDAEGVTFLEWSRRERTYFTQDRTLDPILRNVDGLPRALIVHSVDLGNGSFLDAFFGSWRAIPDLGSKVQNLCLSVDQTASIWRGEQDRQQLIHRNAELRTLYETSQALATSLEQQEVLSLIAKHAAQMVGADICFIFQVDLRARTLACMAVYSIKEQIEPSSLRLKFGEGLSGLVAETGEGLLIKRADMDSRSVLVDGTADDPSSVISIPLKLGGDLLGVMTLEKTPGLPFDEREYHLMEKFALLAVLTFKNAGMYRKMQDLLQSQQMYNILLTHDVANYNVPIHGFLEMLVKDPKLDERQRRYVRSSLTQSENISSLISDVRKLWWLRSEDRGTSFRPMDMVPLINEAISNLNGHILFSNVDISLVTEAGEAWVLADMFLKDVFYNVLSNSCKYGEHMPVRVSITSYASGDGDHWRVEVEDQGKGIPDDRKEKLFLRFDQIDGDTAAEGHGLGLSVVMAFTTHYGGKVWAENRVAGDWSQGTRFVLLLPKSDKK